MAYPTLKNNGWFPSGIPWAEYNSKRGCVSDAAWGFESGNQVVLSILINWTDQDQAIQDLLGTNEFNTASGNIDRDPPMTHMRYDFMYCTRISKLVGIGKPAKSVGALNPFTKYPFALLVLLFQMPKFAILSDGQLDSTYGAPGGARQEWYRYTTPSLRTSTRYVSREQSAWNWAEGKDSGGLGNASGPKTASGTTPGNFNAPIGQPLTGQELSIIWRMVPAAGFYSSGGFKLSANMLGCLETLNNAPLFGYPTGTLRFLGADPKEIEQPNPVGVAEPGPNFCLNITLTWAITDPPAGTATSVAQGANYNAGATTRGHNLAPWLDGYYYAVSAAGNAARSIFSYTDHTQIFRLQQ